jgi:elongator complex protein 1
MNILHDYQPQVFLDNISEFIRQLRKPSRIDEFLSKLKEEDVTKTLYRDTLLKEEGAAQELPQRGNPTPTATSSAQKVNAICEAIIKSLSALPTSPGFTQNIITAHVCKRPPDLTSALGLVSSIRSSSASEADLAVSHLCFLTDSSRLYNAALGLYDLEVALLVAQNAQRDPREYMPFLQSLHGMEVLKRQYTIDNHLKHYSKALVSLHAMDEHETVESYTLKHGLYTTALDLYKYSPTHHATITRHYAAHLTPNSPSQAATLYDSLADHHSAYPLYARAHAWRESLTSATLAALPEDQLTSHALSLATTLTEETRDYRSAAHIHANYLSSPLEAARLLCQGSYFADALLLLSRTSPTSIPTIIDTALATQTGAILSLLADFRSQLSSQLPRIAELRTLKAADPLAFFGGDAAGGAVETDIPDNVSLAPTDTTLASATNSLFTRAGTSSRFGGTVASGMSRKTSKTKRKEERKRARGKKGSVYEEEYLVNSVARLVERWNGTHEEVKRLVAGLARRAMRERAVEVAGRMEEVGTAFELGRREVWGDVDKGLQKDGVAEGNGDSGYPQGRPSGADGVFWESQLELDGELGRKQAPEIKKWKSSEVFV